MTDTKAVPEKSERLVTVEITYEAIDEPVHGCDYVTVIGTPEDGALTIQMFSTTLPIIDNKSRSPMTGTHRKCVGQFHITTKLAQRMIKLLEEQIGLVSG